MSHFFVYALQDPRKNDIPFFIGLSTGSKTTGSMLRTDPDNILKKAYLESLRYKNFTPTIRMINDDITTEDAANYVYIGMIKTYGRMVDTSSGSLTNLHVDGMKKIKTKRTVVDALSKCCYSNKHFEKMKLEISSTPTLSYSTIQIDSKIKQKLVNYCNDNNKKIGKFVESAILKCMSEKAE